MNSNSRIYPKYLLSVLALIGFSLISFRPGGSKQDLMIGKWKLDSVKPAPGNKSNMGERGEEQRRKMEGDEMTFYRDNSVKYYQKSPSQTLNGTWKISSGERGQLRVGTTPNNQETDPGLERYSVLEISLGSGKKSIKITGEDLSVTDHKLYYTESTPKGDKYWYYWAKVPND